jgi:hypothetical protein
MCGRFTAKAICDRQAEDEDEYRDSPPPFITEFWAGPRVEGEGEGALEVEEKGNRHHRRACPEADNLPDLSAGC